jgi:hypothetical protein
MKGFCEIDFVFSSLAEGYHFYSQPPKESEVGFLQKMILRPQSVYKDMSGVKLAHHMRWIVASMVGTYLLE